jgi:hypothetical protein
MYAGDETFSDTLCVIRNKVLPNNPVLPPKHRKNHHPEYKENINLSTGKFEALTNYESFILKCSNTDNENTPYLLQRELPYCRRKRSQ